MTADEAVSLLRDAIFLIRQDGFIVYAYEGEMSGIVLRRHSDGQGGYLHNIEIEEMGQ